MCVSQCVNQTHGKVKIEERSKLVPLHCAMQGRGGSRGGSTRLVRAPLFNLNLLIEVLSHPPTTITSDSLHLWYNKLNNT